MTDRGPRADADVCIIGAGPAGALVAHRAAKAGYSVVVLDAGPRFDFEDRSEREERAIRPGSSRPPWNMGEEGGHEKRDAYTSSGPKEYPLNTARVKGVGGSTLHWQGMVMRLHERDFRLHSETGMGVDWPLSYADLRPYYARAERAFGVAGASDNPFAPPRTTPFPLPAFPPSHSDAMFAEACESLEITTHSVPNARNSESYRGRSECLGYGTCKPVCPSGAKYDATATIDGAEKAGAVVIDRAPVQHLKHDDAGDSVIAAVYATPDGKTHRQEASEFVLAAGGVETPRLLLLSKSPQYPDGLANSSGLVGRYFTDHFFAGVGGVVDERTRQHHVGFNTTESHQFYDQPADGSRTAIKLEFWNYAGPTPADIALSGSSLGDDLLDNIREEYGNHLAIGALVEQVPQYENRVTLDDSKTDDHGNPVPEVVWSLDDRTRRTIERANRIQHRIMDELDANVRWVIGPEKTGAAFHHMGTTRMGTDPKSSVVGPDMRTHDLDNLTIAGSSVFPTTGAMNPTLTIAALSLSAADELLDRLA